MWQDQPLISEMQFYSKYYFSSLMTPRGQFLFASVSPKGLRRRSLRGLGELKWKSGLRGSLVFLKILEMSFFDTVEY